jgi:hypothetical protein
MTVTSRDGPPAVERALQLAGERAPFAMLPRWLLYHGDVSEGAKFLYCVLHDLVQGRQGLTRPVTRAELAGCCGVSVDTIDRRLTQLVTVGAVEKRPQTRPGGQVANIYYVWLLPPGGLRRDGIEPVDDRGRAGAAPVEGAANGPANRSRGSAAPPEGAVPGPRPRGTPDRTGAAPIREAVEEPDQEPVPPQPPRTAGGPDIDSTTPNPNRPPGRTLRSQGANPRAEAERAEQARLEAEARRRQQMLEAQTEARRQADRQAEIESERLEAEARALSAVLDDATLAAAIDRVTPGMSGLLAGSAVAVTRAVIAWCRTAAAIHPGPFDDAVAAGLAATLSAGDTHPPLDLPAAPPDTPALRARIGARLKNRPVT